ncbi:MAG: HD domain-containing protein [Lachnospiraceae bacterium]|nr:HD domain-containing protein [Lachnospiraceae bacterium]
MNIVEEAIIYATIMHQGKVRKFKNRPFILHPLEVAEILSTMTDDAEIITAGILHDIVESTDGTLEEIEKRFGKRVAYLVQSESENEYPDKDRSETWKIRKEESLSILRNSNDRGVKMVWLADKLSNLRSISGMYSEMGEAIWDTLDEGDPVMQCWYYKTVAELIELSLNRTGAFKELIKHINFIWPNTFDSDKARYRKYKEISLDGCTLLGRGAKGEVYRYDDELVIKVFNQNNTYKDVEQEIALARKAFILGVPTAISFGIVSVGDRYGAMFEIVDSETVSKSISRAPKQVKTYARIMAELARTIHGISVDDENAFPNVTVRLKDYVEGGIAHESRELAQKCMALIDTIAPFNTLIHGDFHTGNVFMVKGEPLLIDMDRISTGHPISEISDLYYTYVVRGEEGASFVEDFMGFSYETSKKFYRSFLKHYLQTEDENRLKEVTEKASVICCTRMIRKLWKKGRPSEEEQKKIAVYVDRLTELVEKYDTLVF